MQTIYVDVLIILNIYVNYFLLRITGGITHSRLRKVRCIAASAYGSLYSLLIFVPLIPYILQLIIKLIAAVSIVCLAFGVYERTRILKNTIVFFAVNFLLAGAVYAVYSWVKPTAVHFNNSYFYVDFSLAVLILTTAVMYIAVKLAVMLLDSDVIKSNYNVMIKYHGKSVCLNGLADTGNSLVDYFSGSPVIICDKSCSDRITELTESTNLPEGFRLIPCSTVSESGLIPIFRPDEVIIMNSDDGTKKNVDALVGFGRSNGKAVFNPKILKY